MSGSKRREKSQFFSYQQNLLPVSERSLFKPDVLKEKTAPPALLKTHASCRVNRPFRAAISFA